MPAPAAAQRTRAATGGWAVALGVAVAAGCAISAFFFGFYDLSVWAPIALGLLALALALVVAADAWPPARAVAAITGLLALGAWSFLSEGWGESADAALLAGDRWLLYAAALAVLVFAIRTRRDAVLVIGVAGAGVVAVGVYIVGCMLFGDGPGLFFGGRLADPLGNGNGQAGFLLMGLWPSVALAESRAPSRAAAGMAGATLVGCLLVLTQSRGVALAIVASTALLLVFVPGRRRRAWALLVLACAVAAAAPVLDDVYSGIAGGRRAPADSDVHAAALVALLATVGATALWAFLAVAVSGQDAEARASLRRAADLGLAVILAVGVLLALTQASRLADRARDQYHAFVRLDRHGAEPTRFLSGSGNRYDYWRIAVREFRDQPARGVGAGNYDVGYFRQRRTAENVRQPHSLGLQTLAELGVVGALLLAVPLVAALLGLTGLVRAARREAWARGLSVAAGGTLAAWAVHTDVDWLHLIPGVTGIALVALAVALRPWETSPARPGGRHLLVAGSVALLAATAAVLVARPMWSEHRRTQAREVLATDPAEALRRADDALAANPDSVPAYYVKAAAYARTGAYARARGTLLQAARREPHDFVTWGLLGDLALRRGDRALANEYYRRALALNPRDPGLADQARRTRS